MAFGESIAKCVLQFAGQFQPTKQSLSRRYRDIALMATSQLMAMVELDLF